MYECHLCQLCYYLLPTAKQIYTIDFNTQCAGFHTIFLLSIKKIKTLHTTEHYNNGYHLK